VQPFRLPPTNDVAGKTGKSGHAYSAFLKEKEPLAGDLKVTEEELARHGTKESAWVVLGSHVVYDVTEYLRFHPGGTILLEACGNTRGDALFMKYHSWVNWKYLLSKFRLGVLVR
jgi:cytochrome b involved in lipid metabolism